MINTPLWEPVPLSYNCSANEDTASIYILTHPDDDTPRYVGQTINPTARYRYHLIPTEYDNNPRNHWVSELKEQGLRPRMLIIERVPVSVANAREREWVLRLQSYGIDLLNARIPTALVFSTRLIKDGDDQPYRLTITLRGGETRSEIWPSAYKARRRLLRHIESWLNSKGSANTAERLLLTFSDPKMDPELKPFPQGFRLVR